MFRYNPDNMMMWDTREARNFKYHHLQVPETTFRKDSTTSMWDLSCFIDGFVDWMNRLQDDCYYSTYEDWGLNRGRFLVFYFKSERDLVLFKLFWL